MSTIGGAAVPSAIGRAAFRIVQEALTNVLRHADASSAHVSVRREDADELTIEVTDDGHADTTGVEAGLGLRGMFERATALGGRLDVGPQQGRRLARHADAPAQGGERSMTADRVVLAEDQPMVRAGFRALLDSRDDIEVVGEAATGRGSARTGPRADIPTSS